MKKIISIFIVCIVLLNTGISVQAENGDTNISVRTGGAWYKYRTTKIQTTYKTIVGDVNGIPPGGVKFDNGGSFYIDTYKGPQFSLSVQVGGQYGSVSLTYGGIATGNVTDIVNIPAGGFYKVRATKTYRINLYKVEKSLYGRGKWTTERTYIKEELHSKHYQPYRVWNKTHLNEW